ncbi:MAG: hypothetical protein ACHQX0_07440 [Desulfobaccales bacterium]
MRMALQLFLGLAAAAALAAAEEPAAPLAESKRELKQLQSDNAAAKSALSTTGDLKALAPGLTLQTDSAAPTAPPPVAEPDQSTKPGTGPNWLLDTYGRLDGKDAGRNSGKTDRKGGREEGAGTGWIDRSDPQYLLKAYDQQAQQDRLRNGGGNPGTSRPPAGQGIDPMMPYLQDWLARSPIREVILGTLTHKNSNPFSGADTINEAPDLLGHPGMPEDNTPAGANTFLMPSGERTADNPYLQALALPGGGETGSPVAPVHLPAANSAATTAQSTSAIESTPANSRSLSYKAPPAPSDDDKKYFPQLKRF